MMPRSAPALVATCTAMLGLHSSSSTVSSYSYFALGSALRSLTARSAELRPPSPFAATPPVSGPMKATFTLSLAAAGHASDRARSAAARPPAAYRVLIMEPLLWNVRGMFAQRAPRGKAGATIVRAGIHPGSSPGQDFRAHALLKHGLDLLVVLPDQLDISRVADRLRGLQRFVELVEDLLALRG